MTGSPTHIRIGCICWVLASAAASCAGDPPPGFVKCRTASDCPSDLRYCRKDAAGAGPFCHDSDATQADAATARTETQTQTQRESTVDAGSADGFCARVIAELGLGKVEHCNDFQESLNEGDLFCNYAGENTCPAGQPLLEREGSTNKLFESRLGPEVQKSEVGCALGMSQRYDIRFEYLGPKLQRVDDSSTFAKLWVVGTSDGDFAQVRLRREADGAILEIYQADKPRAIVEKPIMFDASEVPVRLRMRIDLASGLELYVDDRSEPDAKVELQFPGEILPHIGLEGSKLERWARYDNFVVSVAD